MSSVTPMEHTLIGALGGTTEVTLLQPLIALKNAMQEGRPIPPFMQLYRGLPLNIMSIAPISATQFGTSRLVQNYLTGGDDTKLTGGLNFVSAFAGGAASALLSGPAELMIIQQQKSGRALGAEVSHYLKTYGISNIFRGLVPNIGRESLYGAGYLGLYPVVKHYLDDNYAEVLPSGGSIIVAGITGGVFASACSHPFDTAKTRMQAFPAGKPEYATLRSTMSHMYKEGGTKIFFKGLAPRMLRIVGACFILNGVRSNALSYLEEARKAPEPDLQPAM